MLIYVYNWVKNLTNIVNGTNYTYVDDEDITYIVPPKNGNIILFADQPFEYISNTSDIEIDRQDKLSQFVLLSGVIVVLFSSFVYLTYKLAKPKKYQIVDFVPTDTTSELYQPDRRLEFLSPDILEPPPGYVTEEV